MMMASDELLYFGPGAGEHGGKIISQGTPQKVMKDPQSITGKYLSGKKKIRIDSSKFKEEFFDKMYFSRFDRQSINFLMIHGC